jgi:hypothetical protein
MQNLMQGPTITAFVLLVLVVAWESRKRDIGESRHARLNGPGRNLVLNRRRHDTAKGDKSVDDDGGIHD